MKLFFLSVLYGLLVYACIIILSAVSGKNIGILIIPFIIAGYFLITLKLKQRYGPQTRKTKLIIASGLLATIIIPFGITLFLWAMSN